MGFIRYYKEKGVIEVIKLSFTIPIGLLKRLFDKYSVQVYDNCLIFTVLGPILWSLTFSEEY